MKNLRLLSSGCAVLSALIPAVVAQSARPEEMQVAAVETAGVSITEKGALDKTLLFVVDKSSADEAAPQVVQRLKECAAVQMPRELLLSEYDRSLMAATSCFGSSALESALSSLLVSDSQYYAQLAPYMELQMELGLLLEDMAKTLERVNNKRSADAAAEMAQNVPGYMGSLRDKLQMLPAQDAGVVQRALVRRYHATVRPGSGRLLRAWGKLLARDAELYGSARLEAAMPQVNEVLENLGLAADPAVLPQLVEAAEKMEPLMVEWLQVAKGIKDETTANAAAPRLTELAQAIRAASIDKLGSGYEKQLANVSPRLQILMMATDRVSHWFESLSQPYYGSSALQTALEHEE